MKNLLVVLSLLLSFGALRSQDVKIMTYNIKYANENDGENSWSKRKEWITAQVQFYEPDVMGVQEALETQLDYFTDTIEDYAVLGVGREGEVKGEFSALLYKKDKFDILDSDTFWLSETPEKISRGWDADFNRICTYALFQEKNTGKKFYVFNTHFDHVGNNARLESSRLIVRKIKEMNTENFPVFLMGDFNLEPDKEGIQIIKKFLNDSKEEATFTFGPSGTYNGFHFSEPAAQRIDYIFINDKVKINKYAVLSDSKDLKYPSDHFPVMIMTEF